MNNIQNQVNIDGICVKIHKIDSESVACVWLEPFTNRFLWFGG